MSNHTSIQNRYLFDDCIKKPSLWKEHPNMKRKLSSDMENMYEVSLFSGIIIPCRDDIMEKMDGYFPEDGIILSSGNYEQRDDGCFDEYSYSSYISYVVETSIENDAIESRYICLVNDEPVAIEWNNMLEGNKLSGLINCDLHYDDDDETSQVSQHTEFSYLWNELIIQTQSSGQQQNETIGCLQTNYQALCMPTSFNDESTETFDQRICSCEPITISTPFLKISPQKVDEREDNDYILSITRSWDNNSVKSECSAVLNSLKEKKRQLESQFMKNDLYLIHTSNERVEVCQMREYPRLKYARPSSSHSLNNIVKSNSKIKEGKTLRNQETGRFYCCEIFSSE